MTAPHIALLSAFVRAFPALALAAAPAAAQPALEGLITGSDIDRITLIAAAYGPARRQPDDEHGPWIRAELDGIVYTISFLNCQNGTNCTSVQFRAWWESEGAHTVEMMNEWNRDRRFSDAYLDRRGNATIEFDVNLAGGVTAVNFDDTVQWWRAVLREFRSTVIDPGYEAQNPAPQPPASPPRPSK
jgi:hypothetical protein